MERPLEVLLPLKPDTEISRDANAKAVRLPDSVKMGHVVPRCGKNKGQTVVGKEQKRGFKCKKRSAFSKIERQIKTWWAILGSNQ